MCSSCQASQTGAQQWPLYRPVVVLIQALGSPEQGHQILVLCLQQVPSERTAGARGILPGKKKGGTFEPHGESSTGTPRACRGRKSPPMNHGPSWEGNGEGRDGALRDGLSVTLALAIWWQQKPLYLRSPSSTGLVIPAAYRYCGESINVNVFEMFGSSASKDLATKRPIFREECSRFRKQSAQDSQNAPTWSYHAVQHSAVH